MSDQRYTDALLANGKLREERDRLREALAELTETIKINKRSVLTSMTNRETNELMAAMHKANVALLAKEAGLNIENPADPPPDPSASWSAREP